VDSERGNGQHIAQTWQRKAGTEAPQGTLPPFLLFTVLLGLQEKKRKKKKAAV